MEYEQVQKNGNQRGREMKDDIGWRDNEEEFREQKSVRHQKFQKSQGSEVMNHESAPKKDSNAGVSIQSICSKELDICIAQGGL